jgi:hypothetical protein
MQSAGTGYTRTLGVKVFRINPVEHGLGHGAVQTIGCAKK